MKRLLMRVVGAPGFKRGLLSACIALLSASLLADAVFAEISTIVGTTREVMTLSTQGHPKKIKLAYMVMERRTLAEASVNYTLDRWNYGPVDLTSGGRMIGTLQLITENGKQKLGKRGAKCEARIWESEFGWLNQRECGAGWLVEIDLKPGDVLLWTLKFKKMPRLEFEQWEDTVYRDRFTLEAHLFPSD